MISIGDITLFIDDIKQMITLEKGKNIKEALLDFYSNDEQFYNAVKNVNSNCSIKVLVKNKDELDDIFEFFFYIDIYDMQVIHLRTFGISNDEILDCINSYDYDLTNKFIIKIDHLDWVDLEIYKEIILTLKKIVSEIPEDLSPLEIIKHAYDYVKAREYKNVPGNPKSLLSRNLSSSLLGDYIVCAGFTKIFNAILKEFNIKCTEYHFKIESNNAHSVSIVNINDDKYDIHGLYIFDPSADSYVLGQKNETKYKHFMQTIDEYDFPDLETDSFNLLLKKDIEYLKKLSAITKNYSLQKYEDIFESEKFKKILEQILDILAIDYDLFDECFAELGFTDNAIKEKASLYEYIIYLKNKFGKEITHEQFIKLIINTNNDYSFIVNSCISKFGELTEEDIKLFSKRK